MAGRKKSTEPAPKQNGSFVDIRQRGMKPEDPDGLTRAVLVQAPALWKDSAGVA